MDTPAPPSTATTEVEQIEEAPVAVPDDDTSQSEVAARLSRTYTTPDGVPITVMEKPSPEIAVVRRQKSIPKGSTIDSIISPKPRPAKSLPNAAASSSSSIRPASPERAVTEPVKPLAGRNLFPTLPDNVGLFPDHMALREVTIIVNDRTVTDRDGDVLFHIDRKKIFKDQRDQYMFDLARSLAPWRRKQYLSVRGQHKLTFKKRRTKQGKRTLHTRIPAVNNPESLTDVTLQNGMMRLGNAKQNVLVAVVEELKPGANAASGRRMRAAKGFDLAIASAMCFLLYVGNAKKSGR